MTGKSRARLNKEARVTARVQHFSLWCLDFDYALTYRQWCHPQMRERIESSYFAEVS